MSLPKIQAFGPRTEVVGWELTIANGDTATFPGISSSEDNYRDHGVPPSCVRKEITIFLKVNTGYITLRNLRTKKLIAVVAPNSAGGAFVIPTSADVVLRNRTGGTLKSVEDGSGAENTLAVAETFFLEPRQ
jgi:hypothetical protein